MHCNDCNQTLSCFKSARSHYKKFHMANNDGSKFICNLCNEEFAMKYDLMNHLKEIHSRTKIPKWKPTLPCQYLYCNNTFFSEDSARKHYTKLHMAKNDGSKFICNLCNEEFAVKYDLMNHSQEIHSKTKIPKEIIHDKLKQIEDGRIECLDCKKIFSSKETARSHYRKLHHNKRFTCTECSKSFPSEVFMNKHMKAAHMLPRMVKNGENEEFEWKIAKKMKMDASIALIAMTIFPVYALQRYITNMCI